MGEKIRNPKMTAVQFKLENTKEIQKRGFQEVKINYLICLHVLRGDLDLQGSLGAKLVVSTQKAKSLNKKLTLMKTKHPIQERKWVIFNSHDNVKAKYRFN